MAQQEPRATNGILAVDRLTVSLLVDHLNAIYQELNELRQHLATQSEKTDTLIKVMEELLSDWDSLLMTRRLAAFFPKTNGIGKPRVKQTIRGGVDLVGPAKGH